MAVFPSHKYSSFCKQKYVQTVKKKQNQTKMNPESQVVYESYNQIICCLLILYSSTETCLIGVVHPVYSYSVSNLKQYGISEHGGK